MRIQSGFNALLLLSTVLAAAACGSENGTIVGSSTSAVDCSATVPSYTELSTGALAKCTSCHSSTLTGNARNNAPTRINFDTYSAATSAATEGMNEIIQGTMPPPSSGLTLSSAEKQAFYTWTSCGTPE